MKTDLKRLVRSWWHVLSEVPGWPDAPRSVRIRRVMPMIVPCVAAVGLLAWRTAVAGPQVEAIRQEQAPLRSLEEEVAALRLSCSDQQAAELAQRAAVAAGRLLPAGDDGAGTLRQLADGFRGLGWEATFQSYEQADAGEVDAPIGYLPVRGRFTPAPGNPAPFPSLLTALDTVASSNKRIDLVRMTVRTDEQGQTSVETNLRIACRSSHEKTSE